MALENMEKSALHCLISIIFAILLLITTISTAITFGEPGFCTLISCLSICILFANVFDLVDIKDREFMVYSFHDFQIRRYLGDWEKYRRGMETNGMRRFNLSECLVPYASIGLLGTKFYILKDLSYNS